MLRSKIQLLIQFAVIIHIQNPIFHILTQQVSAFSLMIPQNLVQYVQK